MVTTRAAWAIALLAVLTASAPGADATAPDPATTHPPATASATADPPFTIGQEATGPATFTAQLPTLLTKPAQDADLALDAFHWVDSARQLHGVIRVRHVGDHPVGLIERQNSWGFAQWHVVIDGQQVFANPHHPFNWVTKNYFSAVPLRDRDVQYVNFDCGLAPSVRDYTWRFCPCRFPDALMWTDPCTDPAVPAIGPFTAATRVQVILTGYGAILDPHDPDLGGMPAYAGRLCATSTLVAKPDDLKALYYGADGKLLEFLR
jgi:hypothetical protein